KKPELESSYSIRASESKSQANKHLYLAATVHVFFYLLLDYTLPFGTAVRGIPGPFRKRSSSMVRKLTLCLIALFFLAANRPASPEARVKNDKLSAEPEVLDISGYYTCKGVEVGGKP